MNATETKPVQIEAGESKMQSLTLEVSKEVLQRLEEMASARNISISEMAALLIREDVAQHEKYMSARERQLALMRKGLDLGVKEEIPWSREELHER